MNKKIINFLIKKIKKLYDNRYQLCHIPSDISNSYIPYLIKKLKKEGYIVKLEKDRVGIVRICNERIYNEEVERVDYEKYLDDSVGNFPKNKLTNYIIYNVNIWHSLDDMSVKMVVDFGSSEDGEIEEIKNEIRRRKLEKLKLLDA